MSAARFTEKGLLIPFEWLENVGDNPRIQRTRNALFIESPARQDARKKLASMVAKLRNAAKASGGISDDEIDALTSAARTRRAGNP
ncbi:MAG: hypothetical protein ACREBC_32295 [Pyrinomonadaceae bacterium]